MRSFILKHKYFLVILSIFIVCECIVNPIAEFPLNDDWAYSKSVYFALNNHYTIGSFGAMTLATHIAWGALFTKILGFSFTTLRFSTLISALIGLFFLNKLVIKISGNKLLGFFACLILLLNPLYFNLANTFMTDVNFTTLLILCCYCAFNFFETGRQVFVLYFFIFSVALVLLRQFGIISPICFFLACVLMKEKRKQSVFLSIVVLVLVIVVLKLYENYLKNTLPAASEYTFSGSIDILSKTFWDNFFINVKSRFGIIIVHILVYSFPFAVIYTFSILKTFNKLLVFAVATFCFCIVYFTLKDVQFPFHNIFTNMALGPETFKQKSGHNYSQGFQEICQIIKYVFSTYTLIVVFFIVIFKAKIKKGIFSLSPEFAFLICLIATYIFLILITKEQVYFDRYHIPIIAILLIVFSYAGKLFKPKFIFASIPLLCFFYVSVFGTKDYLTINRTKWEVYNYVKKDLHQHVRKINGGFEINCWNEAYDSWWYDYYNLDAFDFLIQFDKEKDFKRVLPFAFQRYFPYKKDTINLYMRELRPVTKN